VSGIGKGNVKNNTLGGVPLRDVGCGCLGPFVRLISYREGTKIGERRGCCEESGEGGGGAEAKLEEGIRNVCELRHDREGGEKRGVFSGTRKCEIPTIVLYGDELGFVDDCPNKVGESSGCIRIENKVE